MELIRQDHEPPLAISEWGWKYHHIGIPTNRIFQDEIYLDNYKVYVSGFETSPFGVEWMRFESGSPISELIQKVPHIAFEVNDLDIELSRGNFDILTYPNSPVEGTRVAMIVHNGAPIELIEFDKKKD